MKRDYTSGSIWKALVVLAVPMVLEMMMEALFSIIDIFWLSKVSENAVATVGLTESVVTLIYAIGVGLASGATAMVARRTGEKNMDAAKKAAAQAVIATIFISVIIGIAGYHYSENILRIMGGEEEMIQEGVWYTKIMMATNMSIMLLFVLNGVFRGTGHAVMAMYALGIANVINIILDPIFIFGYGPIPAMGVEGAAVATSIGRGLGVLFQLYILFKGSSFIQLKLSDFNWNINLMKRLLHISSGSTFQYIIGSASWIIMVMFIADFGTEAVAGYTYAVRIIIFTILPAWGLSNAAATLVGQNLGAKKPDRAEKSVWMTSYVNMFFFLIVSLIFYVFAENLIGFFDRSPKVLAEGVKCLTIFSIGYVPYAFAMVISAALNGAGDTYTPTYMNLVCFWIIEIPLAWYLVYNIDMQTSGVYWAIITAELCLSVLSIYIFRKGNWKKTIV